MAAQAESIRQQVVAFSCGVAEHVSSAWESAVNDVIEITTGFDPLSEGATVLGVPEDVYNVARGVVDVATMLTPGGGAASGARVASNVVGHADDVARVVAGSVDDVARVGASAVNAASDVARVSDNVGDASKVFDANQQAVVALAKEVKRTGVSTEDAYTLLDWADEHSISNRVPEVHLSRPGAASHVEHIHVGPVDHIVVK